MRQLSKSMLSFSWALSLLGIKQALSLMSPGSNGRSGAILDPITETAVGQLDESMKGIFRSGDNLQSRAVDMMFGMMNPGNWNPTNWMSGCGRKAPSGCGTASGAQPSSASAPAPSDGNATTVGSAPGWGPMPEDSSES